MGVNKQLQHFNFEVIYLFKEQKIPQIFSQQLRPWTRPYAMTITPNNQRCKVCSWGVFDVCQRPVSQSVSPPAVGQVYSANVKGQESGLPELKLGNSSPVVAE